ncbi:MAG: hypothetical protein ACLQNE_45410 [Thermoguttaceae bacterium]
MSRATDLVQEQDGEIKRLKAEFDRITDALHRDIEAQKEILDAISSRDSQGNPILNLRHVRANPESREVFDKIVHDSMRQKGTLRIQNDMGSACYILVNGQQYNIDPYASIEIGVGRTGYPAPPPSEP